MMESMAWVMLALSLLAVLEARNIPNKALESDDKQAASHDKKAVSRMNDHHGNQDLWKPTVGSRVEWLRYHGLSAEKWQNIMTTLETVDHLQQKQGIKRRNLRNRRAVRAESSSRSSTRSRSGPSYDVDDLLQKGDHGLEYGKLLSESRIGEGCMWYTEEQAEDALNEAMESASHTDDYRSGLYENGGDMETEGGSGADEGDLVSNEIHSRQKRKIEDMEKRPTRRWHNPIFYKFEGSHTEDEQNMIREAFVHWEERTCMRFFEVNVNAPIAQQHLLLTGEGYGCYSFVGKTTTIPQQVNLAPACLKQFGIPVHEIGHALGLWHEQQRSDRDDWIHVARDNIGFYASQFWKRNTVSHGVPYDYGSVMHYASTAGSFNGHKTMEAHDPLYTMSMGQRVGLSYMDAKIINKEYCQDECINRPLPRSCERGGYQDPNDCHSCVCPDGFSGRYCEVPAPSYEDMCGGEIHVGYHGYAASVIETPGYPDAGYDDFTECNWIIKAPAEHTIQLTFEDNFAVYCNNLETCFHWVEVKYQQDFEYPGPRFCCYQTPEPKNITSETNEMAVIFKSNFPTKFPAQRTGFRATIVAVPPEGFEVENIEPVTIDPSITQEPPGTYWSEWSGYCQAHDCKCGSCSHQTITRMCGPTPCTGDLAATKSRPCSGQCTTEDKFLQYTGSFVWAQCPTCCPGYHLENETCISNDMED